MTPRVPGLRAKDSKPPFPLTIQNRTSSGFMSSKPAAESFDPRSVLLSPSPLLPLVQLLTLQGVTPLTGCSVQPMANM